MADEKLGFNLEESFPGLEILDVISEIYVESLANIELNIYEFFFV